MHVRVTKGHGSKKAVVYFVAYVCALNRTLFFRICKAESRKSEPSLSCALGMKEPVIHCKLRSVPCTLKCLYTHTFSQKVCV